jgi:hypothetical protein
VAQTVRVPEINILYRYGMSFCAAAKRDNVGGRFTQALIFCFFFIKEKEKRPRSARAFFSLLLYNEQITFGDLVAPLWNCTPKKPPALRTGVFFIAAYLARQAGTYAAMKKATFTRWLSWCVGMARFELATSWSQTRRDDRTTLHPERFQCGGEGGIRTRGTVSRTSV